MTKKRPQRPEVKDCSKLICSWLDEFRAVVGVEEDIATHPRPFYPSLPITAWTGPILGSWSDSPEHMFFSISKRMVRGKTGRIKFQAKRLKEVTARNYRPTWILEYILASLYQNEGQAHMIRPNSKTNLRIGLTKGFSLTDMSLYIYSVYENMRDAENNDYMLTLKEEYDGPPRSPRVYGHWTIYPALLNDHTHPYVLDEIRRRVKGSVKRFILLHAINLHRTERRFFNWIERHGAMEVLAMDDDIITKTLAKGLKSFVEECEVYDRPK